MKESFLLYKSFYEPIKEISLEQKGMLLEAIFEYQINGKEPPKNSPISIAFQFIKNQFRLDHEKYLKIVERNRLNGQKGGRPKNPDIQEEKENPKKPKKPSGLSGNPKKPKKADNDNDNDNVNGKVKEKDFYKEFIFFHSEFKELWFDEFLPLKKRKKASVSDKQLTKQLCKIRDFSNSNYKTALEILEKSVNSGWPDFYPPNNNGSKTADKYKINKDIQNDPKRMEWK